MQNETQTIGQLFLLDEKNNMLARWDTLELPWKDNQRRVSCIPVGAYKCKKHRSPRFGLSLWLQDVPNRSEILIHQGNFYADILGCILIGKDLKDLNNDGHQDVIRSKVAMRELMMALTDVNGIMIDIVNSN